MKEENDNRIDALEKNLEKKIENSHRLKEMKKNNVNKINIFDN